MKGGKNWEPSYGYNHNHLSSVNPAKINNPEETILTADSDHKLAPHPWKGRVPAGWVIRTTSASSGPIGIRHSGAGNILWVDGHVTVLQDPITIHLNNDNWDID